MDTKRLASLYPTLSARERVSGLIAAAARGDEVEARRLLDSAPRLNYSVAHQTGLTLGLIIVTYYYTADLLDDACTLWRALCLREKCAGTKDKKTKEAQELLDLVLAARAASFLARLGGWRDFEASFALESGALLAGLVKHGSWIEQLDAAEATAIDLLATVPDFEVAMAKAGLQGVRLPDRATEARSLSQLLEQLSNRWEMP